MQELIQISAKTLGQLALPTFCDRCFYVRLRCHDRIPYAIFPGIFSSIDSFSKKVTASHFAKHGRVPHWFDRFGELGTPIRVPHWSKFNITDATTGITLTGVPDEILRRPDGTLFIGDYKCARFTDKADELLPLYAVQTNVYAHIAQAVGLGHTSGMGLLYYEPPSELAVEDTDTLIGKDGFLMRFSAKVLPIELNTKMVPPLLARVREIANLPYAPSGRDGCKDCALLENLVAVAAPRTPKSKAAPRIGGR
jgi:hypothetical protein